MLQAAGHTRQLQCSLGPRGFIVQGGSVCSSALPTPACLVQTHLQLYHDHLSNLKVAFQCIDVQMATHKQLTLLLSCGDAGACVLPTGRQHVQLRRLLAAVIKAFTAVSLVLAQGWLCAFVSTVGL